MTHFALWGETVDGDEESLWATCSEAEHLFAPAPPPPTPVRYELLGCAPEGDLARAVEEAAVHGSAPLGPLVVELLDERGRFADEWWLQDARVIGSRPCARDLSLTDITVEAWPADQQPEPPRAPRFRLHGFDPDRTEGPGRRYRSPRGRCRELAAPEPPPEPLAEPSAEPSAEPGPPPPPPLRLLGCEVHGPLRDVVEGRAPHRSLGCQALQVLDGKGAVVDLAGHPHVTAWEPSASGEGRYDLTLDMDRPTPQSGEVWRLWSEATGATGATGARPGLWAALDATGRDLWAGAAFARHAWARPDRPAHAVYHLDGRHVTDEEGFFCALGEAVNGPGGYFGRSTAAVSDALSGRFGATTPFTLVWHDHAVARRCLGVSPLTARPASFAELLGFLADHHVQVILE